MADTKHDFAPLTNHLYVELDVYPAWKCTPCAGVSVPTPTHRVGVGMANRCYFCGNAYEGGRTFIHPSKLPKLEDWGKG